jgi:two-component system, sensor histidine kinase and response regulator
MEISQEIEILRAQITSLKEEVEKEKAIRRAIFELLPDMVWVKDTSGKIIDCNEELAKFQNLTRETLIGKTDFDLYDVDRANSYYTEELNIIEANKSFTRRDFNDGDWTLHGKAPVVTGNGLVIGTVGFNRKITNEIKNIAKVEEQRHFQRLLMDLVPDPIYMKDADGHYTKVNLAKAKILGVCHPREAIGKTDRDFLGVNKVIENRIRELEVQRSGNAIISETEKIVSENGETRWYSTSIVPVFDGIRHTNGIVGISRDITTQQTFLQALSRDRVLFKRLMDNLPHYIYFKDKNGCFTRINKAFATQLNLESPDDAIGKTDFDFFEENFSLELKQEEQQIFNSGIAIEKEKKVHFPNGDLLWISIVKIPIPDDRGEYTSIVGMSIDITQRKMAEEKLILAKEKAEESERLKSSFLSNISHEIRTPMNGIIGFTNLLLAGDLPKNESIEYLNHIKNCGHSLIRLFEDIIDISLIESGQIEPHITVVDINELMKELLFTYQEFISQTTSSDIVIEYEGETLPPKVFTDLFRLQQIMNNLLDNAVKFTQHGKISFGVERISAKSLRFWVKDTGVGIPSKKQKEIFEGYGIFKGSIAGQQNTGLGLPISYKLAKLLGGELSVESQKETGSMFSFILPLQIADDTNDSFNTIGSYCYSKLQNKTLLIMEEDETNYIYFRSLLNNSPVSVRWVRNSFDATRIILNEKIDALLLGNEILIKNEDEKLDQIGTQFPHLPIIVRNTSSNTPISNLESLRHTFIQAPVLKEELMSALDKVL